MTYSIDSLLLRVRILLQSQCESYGGSGERGAIFGWSHQHFHPVQNFLLQKNPIASAQRGISYPQKVMWHLNGSSTLIFAIQIILQKFILYVFWLTDATYCENWEEAEVSSAVRIGGHRYLDYFNYATSCSSKDDCYACCAEDDSTNVVIKLEYNSIDAPITVEEDSDVVVLAIKWEWKCGVQQERPEPEGMKAKSPKQLDDSEDPRNPTNISQNRSFFQHDLRRTNDGVLRTSNCSNKKRRMHDGRWKHDKFRKDEQGPKSREEIIATYGYDIRAWKNPYENPQRRLKKQRYLHRSVRIPKLLCGSRCHGLLHHKP
ncbi:hypothetical protein GDO81_009030 [Engystomops pustulosus]|uniref:Protein CASC3 n=1 Tax=Engystomops pustulosus TaxID=76066 RepID=A0AAV7BNI5_ENGPU|nr:hypothetical protein GDO81_009030 [Engystomops pustulosus]